MEKFRGKTVIIPRSRDWKAIDETDKYSKEQRMKCKAENQKKPLVKRYCIICNSEITNYNDNSYRYKKYCDICYPIVHRENCKKARLNK